MNYCDNKFHRRTADLKPYFSVLAIFLVMLIIGIVGQCDFNDKAEAPPKEAQDEFWTGNRITKSR